MPIPAVQPELELLPDIGNRSPPRSSQARSVSSNPSTTTLAINKHAVPRITELPGHCCQPAAVDCRGGRASRIRDGKGILRVWSPIEHHLSANYDAAVKLVIETELTAADERTACGAGKCAPR
jgi:hypothetical protein